jgi:hypothetical protein
MAAAVLPVDVGAELDLARMGGSKIFGLQRLGGT